MEMVSICENLKKLGVPIPRFVDKALESMNEQIQNGSIRKVGDTDGKTKED
jgi:phage-related holin